MAQLGLKPKVAFETNLEPRLKTIVAEGGGVSTFLRIAVTERELIAIPFDPPIFIEAALVWKKHAYLSKATRALLAFLAGEEKIA